MTTTVLLRYFILLLGVLTTVHAAAQTTGPTQPEASSFAPVGVDNLVNLYTGDFNYNIPVMHIPGPDGGYPLNIFYNSNVGMEQDASWVGLGWNLNAGAIQRNLRGLPDDFKGDEITKTFYTKPSTTISFDVSPLEMEILGGDIGMNLTQNYTVYYNNYAGAGVTLHTGLTTQFFNEEKNEDGFTAGLGWSFDSNEGISLSPSLSYDFKKKIFESTNGSGHTRSLALGATLNSKQGFSDYNLKYANKSLGYGTSFASSSPIHPIQTQTNKTSATFKLSIDAKKLGLAPTGKTMGFTGTYARSWVNSDPKQTKSYGAMYMGHKTEPDAITDFYRENDGPILKENVLTPIPVLTYDVFSIQGHGVGGSFRSYQHTIGRLSEPEKRSTFTSGGLGVEIGYSPSGATKVGANGWADAGFSYSGAWKKPDRYLAELAGYRFGTKSATRPLFEPAYFKLTGEAAPIGLSTWDDFQQDKPIAFDINVKWLTRLDTKARAFRTYNRSGNTFEGAYGADRIPRVNHIEQLTRADLRQHYTVPHVVSGTSLAPINYNQGENHHLNGFSVVKPNGVRYNYFLPAYNKETTKVTFAVKGVARNNNPKVITDSDVAGSLMDYARVNNKAGDDEYYSREVVPAYAHTFFITSILSEDYVDVDGNGPTDNDLGSYTKFIYDEVAGYQWRFPYEGAYFTKGYLDNVNDDKATYSEGTKDLYYVRAIETKTHVAVFFKSPSRLTGAGPSRVRQQQLDSIALYSKKDPDYRAEFYLNTPPAQWPAPIQTTHFEQSYRLRKGTPNNSTPEKYSPALDALYVTYQNSKKGENAKYRFGYGENPDYQAQLQDRWGAYQPDRGDVSVNENPYTYQDAGYATRNREAAAWLLDTVTLPSKGRIEVTYEKDDYAYVQNKPAMSYIELIGTGDRVYTSESQIRSDVKEGNTYLYFRSPFPLHNNVSNVSSQLAGIEYLRFRVFMELKFSERIPGRARDYVEGYAEIEPGSEGYIPGTDIGYVRVKPVRPKLASPRFHPFRLAAIQYIRKSRPDLGLDFGDISNIHPVPFLTRNIVSLLSESANLFTGYYRMANVKGWASAISEDKPSYIRLVNPQRKFGGGARVAAVRMTDGEGPSPKYYGQTYTYELPDGRSSGVAEFEPLTGLEESAFTQPIWLDPEDKQKTIFSNEHSIPEDPLGAGLYPSANVGYSRVVVAHLDDPRVTYGQAGINVAEFYTARDFPTRVQRSGALYAPYYFALDLPLIGSHKYSNHGYSSGYSFTLNSAIYGTQKSEATYPYTRDLSALGEPIQKSVYHYKTKAGDNRMLDNEVTVLHREGQKERVLLGREVDFYIDEIESQTYSTGLSVNPNVNYQPPVAFLPSLFPGIRVNQKSTRYLTTNKLIYNQPVLDSIVQYKDGAKITTSNLYYDYETGEPIITSVTNEFRQPVYTYNFPAHWSYEKMKGAYRNFGARLQIGTQSPGNYELRRGTSSTSPLATPVRQILTEGDEISTAGTTYYVDAIDEVANTFTLRDRGNQPATFTNASGKVIRSGYRNLQSTKKGKIVSLQDYSGYAFPQPNDNMEREPIPVLHADATEFKDEWDLNYADLDSDTTDLGHTLTQIKDDPALGNPYAFGMKNTWRPHRTSAYLEKRKQSNTATHGQQVEIDKDGEHDFYPFVWHQPIGYNEAYNWRWVNEVTAYNPNGASKEGRNRLDIHAASLFGYHNHLVTASASNARATDIAFDSFEDYEGASPTTTMMQIYTGRGHGNLDFNRYRLHPEGHTGNFSLFLEPAQMGLPGMGTTGHDVITFESDLNGPGDYFTPDSGTYHIALWVKKTGIIPVIIIDTTGTHTRAPTGEHLPPALRVAATVGGSAIPTDVSVKTDMIDGWFLVEGTLEIPAVGAGVQPFRLTLANSGRDYSLLIDDLRIQPFNAGMECYVYDPANYRLLATFGDQHFATFYNYDEEGRLAQTRVETERGTKTVAADRSHIKEQP